MAYGNPYSTRNLILLNRGYSFDKFRELGQYARSELITRGKDR